MSLEVEDEIRDGSFEFDLTPEEIRMFERLAAQEQVHNKLGALLGAYRESILAERNQFMRGLQKKYRIRKPHLATYDPAQKKIISIFNPTHNPRKIESSPMVFHKMAVDSFMDLIRNLQELLGVK